MFKKNWKYAKRRLKVNLDPHTQSRCEKVFHYFPKIIVIGSREPNFLDV